MSYGGVPAYDVEDTTLPDGTPAKRLRVTLAEAGDLRELLETLVKLQAVAARQLAAVTGKMIDPDEALQEILLS